jgi:hypothetical protein
VTKGRILGKQNRAHKILKQSNCKDILYIIIETENFTRETPKLEYCCEELNIY